MPVSFLASLASLAPLALAARLVAPSSPEAAPPAASPAASLAASLAAPLPTDGVAPLGRAQADRPGEAPSRIPSDGVEALDAEELSGAEQRPGPAGMPADGVEALEDLPATSSAPPAAPLGLGPKPDVPAPLDPKRVRLVRVDAMIGSVWRIREADASLSTSVEYGQMHGFSGAFHTEMLVVTDRNPLKALDFPIGVGAIARGRLRNRALYGSVGLTAGILVHRASREEGVIHRVDPDFRVPIRLAWTAHRLGVSLAIVPAYSVRDRIYERRGGTVFERRSVRIGLMLGLHWDVTASRAPASARRRDRS